jgi:hypothetical protein
MAIQCWKCIELANAAPLARLSIECVPTTGRAAKNGLCCKHDRELNGLLSEEEKGEKQKAREERKKLQNAA